MKGKGRVSDRLIAGLGLYMEFVGRRFWGPGDVRESRLMNKCLSPRYSTHNERKKVIQGCSKNTVNKRTRVNGKDKKEGTHASLVVHSTSFYPLTLWQYTPVLNCNFLSFSVNANHVKIHLTIYTIWPFSTTCKHQKLSTNLSIIPLFFLLHTQYNYHI